MEETPILTIKIVSDYVWPYCLVGKKLLKAAIKEKDIEDMEILKELAEKIGLPAEEYTKALKEGTYSEVEKKSCWQAREELDVTSIPTFFIHGNRYQFSDYTVEEAIQILKKRIGSIIKSPRLQCQKVRFRSCLHKGMELSVKGNFENAAFVGIRMHDLRPGEGENSVLCRVVEEIENPFSYVIMLRPESSKYPSLVGWETDKATWESLRQKTIPICLPREFLIPLE